MKAFVIESTRKVESFGDQPGDCLIANRKLGEIQRQVLQSLGTELKTMLDVTQIEELDEYIFLRDSLFFSKERK